MTRLDSAAPDLSVIIACYRAHEVIGDCLASLGRQQTRHLFEVIVVNSSPDATGDIIREEFPWVRCLQFPERKYAGDARNEGIAVARGRVIALTDADCLAAPDWIDAIVAVHDRPDPVVGGAIINANPASWVSRAGHLLEFHRWLPSTPAGWVSDAAGANLSYKREIFDRFGPFMTGTYGSDTEYHWRLAAAGHRVRFEPSIRVFHRNIERFGRLLAHEVDHGRCFARVRVGGQRLSRTRRAVFAGLFPLIGLQGFLRSTRSAVRSRDARRGLVSAAPGLLAAHAAWSLGEAFGYVAGGYPDGSARVGDRAPRCREGKPHGSH